MKGWIKIHREITEHWIWQDEKYFRWWITILLSVNYEVKTFPVNNELYACNPGESFRSIEQWAALFGCSKKTVLRFFGLLKNERMINTKTVGKGNRRKHLLTVRNWQKYQQKETENDTEIKPEITPKVTPNKNNKEDKKDLFDQFWDLYDKKVGKKETLTKWDKLQISEMQTILNHVPLYKQSQPDKKFRKDPERYISHRVWEDEIISSINGKVQQHKELIMPS